MRNEEVLHRVKEKKNILHEISKRKSNWIGQILRRNCLVRQVIEGKIKGGIEMTARRGRRRRKLLDELNPLKPNGHCSGTAPLTSRRWILNIYSTNIRTEYFKAEFCRPFSRPSFPPSLTERLHTRAARGPAEGSTLLQNGRPWSSRRELKEAAHRGQVKYRPTCLRGLPGRSTNLSVYLTYLMCYIDRYSTGNVT
jgi:hypothetical protein